MTSTFTKISISIAFLAILFSLFGLLNNSNVFINDVSAATGCSDCGGGDGGGGDTDPDPDPTPDDEDPDPVIPVCTITAAPASIVNGNSSTLSWTATRANTASINQGIGAVSVRGTKSVSPTATITYTMTVRSSTGNTATCSARVTVIPKPVVPPSVPAPTCVLSATPSTINVGGSAKLSWTSNNAVSGTINQAVGIVDPKNAAAFKTVSPAQNTTYTMTVKNSAGATATCVRTVTVKPKDVVTPPSVPAPTCVLNATPATVVKGGTAKLTWTSANAVSGSINQAVGVVDPKSTSDFRNVTPLATTLYTMTVKNSAGATATCVRTVTVKPKDVVTPPSVPAPTCVLNADKTTVSNTGTVKLTWTSTNSISGTINQAVGVVDPKATADFKIVKPGVSKTYILTVKNSAGVTKTCSKTITVPGTVTPPDIPAPTCVLKANKTIVAKSGDEVVLSWTSMNSITGVITPGDFGVDPKEFTAIKKVYPTKTTVYTLTVKNSAEVPATCRVTITVPNTPPSAFTCENNVTFNANPTSIREGDSTTLTWATDDATTVSINGVNSTALDGSEVVSPRTDTQYNLIATKGEKTISCPVTVNVDENNNNGGGGGGGSSSVKCSLKISDDKISLGERVTLKWDTTRATEVTIKDNHGKTLIDTDDKSSREKKDLYDGEITIRPDRDTTYTLVAEKGSKDKTCKVDVDVEDTIVVTQVRDQQPLVNGISLTSVPYTGFEAGPFMTSIFYTLLAAWALYMAYVLTSRRNGMNVSAFTPATVASDIVPSEVMFPTAVATAPVFYQAPVAAAVASTATVGYAAHVDAAAAIEAQAHAAHVLLSSDATAYFIAATANEDRESILSGVLAAAKASYPSEDGWVVISADRMIELASKY